MLLEDLTVLRPTFLLGMASFWSRLHSRYERQLNFELDEEIVASIQDAGAIQAVVERRQAPAPSTKSLPRQPTNSFLQST